MSCSIMFLIEARSLLSTLSTCLANPREADLLANVAGGLGLDGSWSSMFPARRCSHANFPPELPMSTPTHLDSRILLFFKKPEGMAQCVHTRMPSTAEQP